MDALYLLLVSGACAAAWFFYRHWYGKPSGMPEMLLMSYSYQTLRRIAAYAKQRGIDLETEPASMTWLVMPYLKDRRLSWRQRNDVVSRIVGMDWVYRDPQNTDTFTLGEAGALELKSATALRLAAGNAARELSRRRLTAEQAKAEAAAATAVALRVDASIARPETRQPAEAVAQDMEDAVRKGNQEAIDRAITRAKDILEIATYALPFARDIVKIIGW